MRQELDFNDTLQEESFFEESTLTSLDCHGCLVQDISTGKTIIITNGILIADDTFAETIYDCFKNGVWHPLQLIKMDKWLHTKNIAGNTFVKDARFVLSEEEDIRSNAFDLMNIEIPPEVFELHYVDTY